MTDFSQEAHEQAVNENKRLNLGNGIAESLQKELEGSGFQVEVKGGPAEGDSRVQIEIKDEKGKQAILLQLEGVGVFSDYKYKRGDPCCGPLSLEQDAILNIASFSNSKMKEIMDSRILDKIGDAGAGMGLDTLVVTALNSQNRSFFQTEGFANLEDSRGSIDYAMTIRMA